MGFSSGSGGAVSSPVNLVTTAAAIVLANKLLAGDANPTIDILGSGEIDLGIGGATAVDTLIKRASGGQVQIGQGNAADTLIGRNGASALLSTQGNDSLQLATSTGGVYITLTGGAIQLDDTLQNKVAGNEAATATAGGGAAVPATVLGFLIAKNNAGTTIKIPFFAN